ncbi:MAG: MFS transporter [Rhodospirillaceae bacterium]|nr:MFS transporter [Rhodospirillaceae bacterium]
MSSLRTGTIAVIACGGIILLLSFGIRSSYGVFLQPVSTDLGWSREIFALTIALQNLFWGFAQPFAGMIADRYGSARVIIGGALMFGAGTLLMGYATTPLTAHIGAGFLVGVGIAGCGFSTVLAAVGRSVAEEWRSMALGVASAGGSLGLLVMVPMGQAFIDSVGWSVALIYLAALSLLMVPLAAALAGKPAAPAAANNQTITESLREAAGHNSFLFLNAGYFVCGFHVTFITTHFPAYVVDLGLGAEIGAWAIGIVGIVNVFSALGAGALGDKFNKKYVLSTLYLCRAAAIAIFMMTPPSVTSVMVFAAMIGLFWLGTVPVTSALVMQMFGLKHASMLLGIVFLSHQLGSFLGAWIGGYMFELSGSYDMVWWISVGLGVAAAALHWPIDERPIERPAPA